jgi:hypothetical protein
LYLALTLLRALAGGCGGANHRACSGGADEHHIRTATRKARQRRDTGHHVRPRPTNGCYGFDGIGNLTSFTDASGTAAFGGAVGWLNPANRGFRKGQAVGYGRKIVLTVAAAATALPAVVVVAAPVRAQALCGTMTASAAPRHVLIVMLENRRYSQVVGNSAAP